ncbi:MAG: SPOR domain-containing protein [Gemmatimonadaceae bacterium]
MAKLLMRRTLILCAAALAACGGEPKGLVPVAGSGTAAPSGTDALVLRVPLGGGTARVFPYPRLDSAVWTSSGATPAIERVLAFDDDAGALAVSDSRAEPGRIDFRLGRAERLTTTPVFDAQSADGAAIFALNDKGEVTRFTESGNWTYKPPRPARAVFPQRDGTLLVVAGRDRGAVVWKLFPPDAKIIDSASFPTVWRPLPMQVGDRLYLVVDSGLVVLSTRTLDWGRHLVFSSRIAAAVSSPSGDRVFVINESSRVLSVVDRYRDEITKRITLPGQPLDLRVDPLGRYVLARAAGHDSAWVIAVGTERAIGAVATSWRTDLPFVAPDGAIGLAQGKDVAFVDGETLRPVMRVSGGAEDFWYAFRWNGFRPRLSSLDQPVSFNLGPADSARTAADAAAADAAAKAALRTTGTGEPPSGAAARRDSAAAPTLPPARAAPEFVVSFAALLSEGRASDLAAQIRVDGVAARVVMSVRDGTPIYRVVLGPYATRDEAERVGRAARHAYWVYEATP